MATVIAVLAVERLIGHLAIVCIQRMSKFLLMTCRVSVGYAINHDIRRSLNAHKEERQYGEFAEE